MRSNEIDVVRLHDGAGLNARPEASASAKESHAALFELTLGVLSSVVLHLMLLVGLAVLFHVVPRMQRPAEIELVAVGRAAAEEEPVQFEVPPQAVDSTDVPLAVVEAAAVQQLPAAPAIDQQTEIVPQVATRDPIPAPANRSRNRPLTGVAQPQSDMPPAPDVSAALSGRTGKLKQALLQEAGGHAGSERAVQLALAWLAEHQQSDGSWRLDHQTGHCAGRCGNAGSKAPARNGATALALLPFLGSGHTHVEGGYAEVVKLGLDYLIDHIRPETDGGSLMDEGQMYSHALATIAICEALAMSRDRALFSPAQEAVDFIVAAQHAEQGGWRYRPGEPGDTTVTGWQLMALKTASMSYVHVPPQTIRSAWSFIDSVELPKRYQYAYQSGGRYEQGKRRKPTSERYRATSAVGLLCRMYLGWDQEQRALVEGIDWLDREGPSLGDRPNLYYDYYATQVMRHFGGPAWEGWNDRLRDFLIETQQQRGHPAGSWFFPGQHNEAGGRLYCTSLATMILEVYYRHMPLYSPRATAHPFAP